MGDRLRMGKPSRYVTSHPGQLSLAIPPWVGAMSTSESWGVNRHTMRYTSPISVVSQCKLVSGWGLRKRRSAPPYGPCGSGRTLLTFISEITLINYCQWCRQDQNIKSKTKNSWPNWDQDKRFHITVIKLMHSQQRYLLVKCLPLLAV